MSKFLVALALAAFASTASAQDFDGCYELYEDRGAYPSVCISGTKEEGIAGSSARLAIFHPSSSLLQACLESTSIKITDLEFVFEIDGRRELVFSNFSVGGATLSGDAQIGRTQARFTKIEDVGGLIEAASAQGCN